MRGRSFVLRVDSSQNASSGFGFSFWQKVGEKVLVFGFWFLVFFGFFLVFWVFFPPPHAKHDANLPFVQLSSLLFNRSIL